jgi:hypothetical protein
LLAKLAEIETLYKNEKRKNARAALANKKPELKVAVKSGCVQINGIRRLPICLYPDEMTKILNMYNDGTLKKFMDENAWTPSEGQDEKSDRPRDKLAPATIKLLPVSNE